MNSIYIYPKCGKSETVGPIRHIAVTTELLEETRGHEGRKKSHVVRFEKKTKRNHVNER